MYKHIHVLVMKIKGFQDTIDWYDNNADVYSASANRAIPFKAIDYFLSFLPAYVSVCE